MHPPVLLRRIDPTWYTPPPPSERGIELTYLGTAGFIVRGAARTVVLDPFVTRPGPLRTLFGRLRPNEPLIARLIPIAADVLVGHSHHDHVLDAPALCRQTGARLIGSSSTAMVARAAGLPETQILATSGREDIRCGDWVVRGLPSLHGQVLPGWIPYPGDILEPPPWPPRARELRSGLVLNWLIDTGGLRILHIDSADFLADELRGIEVDVLCLCAIGRRQRRRYVAEVVECVKPRFIVPCHWDTMLTPIEQEPDLIPGVDLPGFLREIRQQGVEPLLVPPRGRLRFAEREAVRGS